jgi:transcriptional regulator with PAS, ATPase and Fis domain
MSPDNEDNTTIREVTPLRQERAKTPVLLVSSFVSQTSRVLNLTRDITIGRGRTPEAGAGNHDTEVILHSDGALSRPHLRVTSDRDGWSVEDLDSTNGTFVDGRRVKKPVPLSDGSIVQFGGHAGVFRRVTSKELAAIEQEAAEPLGPIPALSPVLAVTSTSLRRLAGTDASLLFSGETGVGKEVYARAVHAVSGRSGPFVAINCAALPAELVESELFGYARGAHSTATAAKPGLVELADGGTLLLDEIGDMPPRVQAKLFRFLQDRQVLPLGSTRTRRVDVRVVAATSSASVSVRSDLVGRLGAEPIVIPPLRDRIEDVGPLVGHLGGASTGGMEPAAFRALCLHDWPRNVRELEEVVKRAITLAGGGRIRLDDLSASVRGSLETGPRVRDTRKYRSAPSRGELERLLRENRGNVAAVAKTLDRQWNVVQRWLRRLEIEPDRYRA